MLFKIVLLTIFILITYYLSYVGMKKTKDIKSFSIGNKDMNPYLIGITMATSISSTATFVINPGFVYTHGLSAYLHYGVAAGLGVLAAFILITKEFRSLGDKHSAITIPDWIYHRYQNRQLSLYFALINLLSITFVVLILVGCSLIVTSMFPISQTAALTLILLFVFSYVLMGGTYAHAYTNTFQGFMMIIIALYLFFQGFHYFGESFIGTLNSVGENYAKITNPDSNLYYDSFSVFVSGFIITFALMLQPHILTKVLYIKNNQDVKKFISTTFVVGLTFNLVLFIGFYAKIADIPVPSQDQVVTQYILHEFAGSGLGEFILTFVSLTMLAAGLSTLDGILVAISSMVVNDIFLPFNKSTKSALTLSRIVLVFLGTISYIIALDPPKLVGLFAQKGVYGLAAASFVPILFGVLSKKSHSTYIVFSASLMGLFSHLYLNIFGGVMNPAVSATYGIFLSVGTFFVLKLVSQEKVFVKDKKQQAL